MWAWLAQLAIAKPYPVELELAMTTAPEPGPFGFATSRTQTVGVRVRGPDVAGVEVDGGKLRTVCGIRNGYLSVEIGTRADHYPEHLPEELGCRLGRYDVRVRILAKRPLYTEASELWVDPAGGVELRAYGYVPQRTQQHERSYGLSPEVQWVEGSVPAEWAGAPWPDAWCTIRPGDKPVLLVHYTEAPPTDGVGRCVVPDEAGQEHAIGLRFAWVPPDP